MFNCLQEKCIGWAVLEGDHFCSWCGSPLVEVELEFEQHVAQRWLKLSPALVLRHKLPPLRIRLRHKGSSGSLPLSPNNLSTTAGWLGLDTNVLQGRVLNPGESVTVPVNRLKVPGKDRSIQEVDVELETPSITCRNTIQFVPPPQFQLDLATQVILLCPGSIPTIDATLRLTQGKAILTRPPQFQGRWVTLSLVDAVTFPLELDSRGISTLALKLTVKENTVESLRQGAMDQRDEALRRGGILRLENVYPENITVELPVEVRFLLGPELTLTPFGDRPRLDWKRIQGLDDSRSLPITITNGTPGTPGRIDLTIYRIELSYQTDEENWCTIEGVEFPLKIASGESLTFHLKADPLKMPGNEATVCLSFACNDKEASRYYIRVINQPPQVYPGWLVIDLGTSNTCAALVDDNQQVTLLPLEENSLDGNPVTLPSAVCYLELVKAKKLEVGSWAWARATQPAASRAVVTAAKRYLGDQHHRFEVVPVDEPEQTCYLRAREVVKHILEYVIDQAIIHLAQRNNSHLILKRILICHPSRFSVHQIEELKTAAVEALKSCLSSRFTDPPEPEPPHTLHEPIGAALHYLNDWKNHARIHNAHNRDKISYSLLVYDFGGGTLDITLVRIMSQRQPRFKANQPSPTQSFEDALRKLISQRCRELIYIRTSASFQISPEHAETNRYLLDQFVTSAMDVITAEQNQLLANPREHWPTILKDPRISSRLTINYCHQGEASEIALPREEVLPSTEEFISHLLPLLHPDSGSPLPPDDESSHPYNYVVAPEVLGATGHRWLGGEDVTRQVKQLLIERLTAAIAQKEKTDNLTLILPDPSVPPHLSMRGRHNESVLHSWAETLKIKLSQGAPEDELRSTYQSIYCLVEGEERLYSGTSLWKLCPPPTLDEIQRHIAPKLKATISTIKKLLSRHELQAPDVLLQVGKASRLPIVREILTQAFPSSHHVMPEDSKECVVKGAATHPVTARTGGGVQLSRGLSKPSVRIRLDRQQPLNATTTRLGIKASAAGEALFIEAIGEGVPVPPEGLSARVDGIIFSYGDNRIQILENAGHTDQLVLPDGTPNPDISRIKTLEIHIPDTIDQALLEKGVLTFFLSNDLDLKVELSLGETTYYRTEEIDSSEFGSKY